MNIDGIHHPELIQLVGDAFTIHKLHLEDVLNTLHRPKLDEAPDYYFVTLKMIRKVKKDRILFEHVSLFLFADCVITFQESRGDLFNSIRQRISENKGQARQRKADYLFCLLIDAVVDQYFLVLDDLVHRAETFEDEIFQSPDSDLLFSAKQLKKDLNLIKRAVAPLRDILGQLVKQESAVIQPGTHKYFSDVLDSTLHVLETIESTRDTLSNVLEIYVSSLSIKMNNVMRILTIIATIFIPLTFLVGIYGMNFRYMPELDWKWGYPALIVLMIVLVMGMLVYFRKKDWL